MDNVYVEQKRKTMSTTKGRNLESVLARIDKRREEILRRCGLLNDSSHLIREDRDSR